MKIPTGQRARRMQKKTRVTTSFLRHEHEQQGRRRCDEDDEAKSDKAGDSAKAA
jgi:hypothetical protein